MKMKPNMKKLKLNKRTRSSTKKNIISRVRKLNRKKVEKKNKKVKRSLKNFELKIKMNLTLN